jgi:hypothetical protein
MAELADAADSKSAEGNLVGVRPPLPAPIKSIVYEMNASSDAFFCAQTVPKAQNFRWKGGFDPASSARPQGF